MPTSAHSPAIRSYPQAFRKVVVPIWYRNPERPEARTPGLPAAVVGPGATPAPKTRQRASLAPMLADLRGLWGGRDRLLRVAEVAEHLGVCNATVYRLCDSGELPHVWIVNSIRIRPADLQAFLDRRAGGGERGQGP
jgi:excisionase family DNA binding protein